MHNNFAIYCGRVLVRAAVILVWNVPFYFGASHSEAVGRSNSWPRTAFYNESHGRCGGGGGASQELQVANRSDVGTFLRQLCQHA